MKLFSKKKPEEPKIVNTREDWRKKLSTKKKMKVARTQIVLDKTEMIILPILINKGPFEKNRYSSHFKKKKKKKRKVFAP